MKWLLLAVAALLAGCAGEPARPVRQTLAPVSADAAAAALRDWRVEGRIAIQRGNEGWSAKLRWQQHIDEFQMRLIAPLGRGTYQLAGGDGHVELLIPDGRTFTADDPETLMRTHLGWSIPVGGVEYWMRGLVAPGAEPLQVRRDESGRLTDLQQNGWRVSILKHTQAGEMTLPAKLFMHFGDLKVRIIVAQWKLNPA